MKMAPRSVNRKTIHKYFEFENGGTKCRICLHRFKTVKLFNLKMHAIKMHNIEDAEFLIASSDADISSKYSSRQSVKLRMSKKQLFRSYIGLVTEDNLTFSVLNSENLRSIVNPICKGVSNKLGRIFALNAISCQKALHVISDKVRVVIKADLRQRFVSLYLRNATGLSDNIFLVSAQFIKDYKMQSHTLGMLELKNADVTSSWKLVKEIKSILTKYNVDWNQIIAINSDMMKAARLVRDDGISEDNETYLQNIKIFEESAEMFLQNIPIYPCALYMAQLCAYDLLKDPDLMLHLVNSRNLVKFLTKPPNGFEETFQSKQLTMPHLDCVGNWESSYDMIKSIKEAKSILEHIEPVKATSAEENFELNAQFWSFVEAYCLVLQPLQNLIAKFRQEQLHYGNFYAEWLKCKIYMEKLFARCTTMYMEKILKRLVESMSEKTKDLLKNEMLLACLYLDPRFQRTLTKPQKLQAMKYLKKLHDKVNSIYAITLDSASSTASSTFQTEYAKKATEYLDRYLLRNFESQASARDSFTRNPDSSTSNLASLQCRDYSECADDYLNEYLAKKSDRVAGENGNVYSSIENLQLQSVRVDTNILNFWKERQEIDPELYSLSNICFAVSPTGVS